MNNHFFKRGIRVVCVGVLAACLFSASFSAKAQNKFGHINTVLLLNMMPEAKDADKKLQDFASGLQTQLKTMTTEYQGKVSDYEKSEKTYSETTKQTKVKEIEDLQARIQKFNQDAQQEASDKQNELMAPVLDKARSAIQDVAKSNSITYVFDTSKGDVIIFPDSDDILPLVKKKLGITAPTPTASSQPAPAGGRSKK